MFPHIEIHGRSDDDRTFGGQVGSQQYIITLTVSHCGDCVGGSRGDYKSIGPHSQFYVIFPHSFIEKGGNHFVFAECTDAEWSYKIPCCLCHDDTYLPTRSYQQADEQQALISRSEEHTS